MPHHVYILRCADQSYYVGSTRNLAKRIAAHNDGLGARYTARRRPVQLVYAESLPTLADAVRRERQLKRWSRAMKEALLTGDFGKLNRLGRSRYRPS